MSPKQTCDAKIAHTNISYDPYQTRATHTQQKTSAQSSRPAHPTFPRRANNMNNHQTLTPAPREHDSAPPPLPHDPKHNATHIDLRTTWKHTALPAPRNILQAPNATQRRTVIRRSPNTSRTGPSVREHHAKLPRIMASARPSSLTPPAPRAIAAQRDTTSQHTPPPQPNAPVFPPRVRHNTINAQHGSTQPCRRRATSYRHPTRHNVEPSSDVPRTPPALAHPSASTTRNYSASWPPRALVRLPPRAPRNRSTARHNKPTHATAPTKRTCVSTTRVPQHYQRYCDAMPILLADTSNVRTTHMLTYLYPVYTTRMITHIATLSITHLL